MKTEILGMIKNNLRFELDPELRSTLLAEAEGGNQWAQSLINVVVDRGRLLQHFNQALILLGLTFVEIAETDKSDEEIVYYPESDLATQVFWFLHNLGFIRNGRNEPAFGGFDEVFADEEMFDGQRGSNGSGPAEG